MFDIIAIGELLADFIGTEMNQNLYHTQSYVRFQGGSPSNLAANMARLGGRAAIVSSVGNDNLGQYLIDKVAATGIDTQFIQKINHLPTSIVLVSRTQGTPDFIAYRQADCQILPQHLPQTALAQTKILHTTCFALSQQPAQATIVQAMAQAAAQGTATSIDLNYAPEIWHNRTQAHQIIDTICGYGSLVKLSTDDFLRLYPDQPNATPQDIIQIFIQKNAKLVCLTTGKNGSWVATQAHPQPQHTPAHPLVQVGDATGAGDAFWAAFLMAYNKGYAPTDCAKMGSLMAKLKLETIGALPDKITLQGL
jgi:fructokinase